MDISQANWSSSLDGSLFQLNVKGNVVHGCHWPCVTTPLFVIIFIHGLNSNLEISANFLRVFPEHNFTVFAADHLGNGFSPGKQANVEDIIDETFELIKYARKLYPSLPIYLLGHSMGGLSLLKMALAYPDSLHDIAGIIAHAPWITTYSNRRPNKFLSLLINILYYIYPQFKVNTGLKISEAPYPEEYKKMAIATGHLKSTITIDVTKSSFTAMDYVIQHYDKYPDIPLLLLQGEADDCVSPTKNIKWANKVKELKGDIIEIVDYKEGPHDLLKSGTRKRAFEDMFSFVERVSNKPKDQKETKKQTTNDEL